MKRLPVNDLLTCRLVSRFWKSTATVICRQRHVFLKSGTSHSTLGEKLDDLYSTFQETDVMPWSGCRLQFSDDQQVKDIFFHLDELNWRQLGPMTSSDLQNFLDKFGTRILNLSLGGNVLANNNIFPLLKGTPNLEVFKYNSFLPSRDMNIPELIIPLHKLQYLEYFLFTPEDVTLLEFLLTAAPCIKAVKIKFGIEWRDCSETIEEVSRLVKLISGIPSISFEADTDRFDALDPTALKNFTDLKLTEMDFCVPVNGSPGERAR